jgi:hypothetical protein
MHLHHYHFRALAHIKTSAHLTACVAHQKTSVAGFTSASVRQIRSRNLARQPLGLIRRWNSLHTQSTKPSLQAAFALLVAVSPFAAPQTPPANKPATDVIAVNSRLELPDSPGALLSSSSNSADAASSSTDTEGTSVEQMPAKAALKHAPHLRMIIAPDQIADPMTVHDKVVSGFKDSFSPFSAAGWLSTAGWQQLRNKSPNYGTNGGAFGQRLGAATIHATSEGLFRESLFAPLFHEDQRYYIMGKGHPFSKRIVYAATRSIITRTDSGHATPNFARLAGDAAGSALTIPYYPAQNTTFSAVASTFGRSLGGSALGFVVDEFLVDALVDLKLRKKQ